MHSLNGHVFLFSFNLKQILSLSLSFMNLTFWTRSANYFVVCPSVLVCMLPHDVRALSSDTCQISISWHHIVRYQMLICLITGDINFYHLPRWWWYRWVDFYFTQRVTICVYHYLFWYRLSWTQIVELLQTGSGDVLTCLHHSASNSLSHDIRCSGHILNFSFSSTG